MAHWLVYSLRGWIAFLAFMNAGTAARCFFDDGFLYTKVFVPRETAVENVSGPKNMNRLFGVWSLLNAVIYIHCALALHNKVIISIAVCTLILYLSYYLIEAIVFRTVILYGSCLFPMAMSGITLAWMIIGYQHIHGSPVDDSIDENELLRKNFPLRKLHHHKKLR